MKSQKSIVDNRRVEILDYINHKEDVKNIELEEKFKVSSITIRRDLDYLQSLGHIKRYHGGARINYDDSTVNQIIEDRKERIAQKCAELVMEDYDIFINSSSTAILTLKYIKNKRLSVITNNTAALNMDLDGKIKVALTGGKVNYPKNALTGAFAFNNLSQVSSDILIMGTSGIADDGFLTTQILDEVDINKYMMAKASSRKILVCDSSKFGKPANYRTEHISIIDTLITDSDIKRETLEYFESVGVQVILV